MQDRVNARVTQQALHAIAIGVATNHRRSLIWNRVGMAGREVIEDHNTMAPGDQGVDTCGTDVSGPTRYQD